MSKRHGKKATGTAEAPESAESVAAGLKQIREANEVLAKNMKQEPTDEPAGTAGAPAETAGAPKRAAPAPSAANAAKKPKTTTSPTTTVAAAKARKAARASKATAPTAEAKEPATKAPKTASASTEAPRASQAMAPPDAAKEPATKAPKKASASEEPEVSPEPEGSLQPEVSPESDCSQPKSILRRPAAATPTEKASVSFSGALQAAGAEAQRLAASVAPGPPSGGNPPSAGKRPASAGPVAPSADDDELDLDSVDINEICRLLGKSRDTLFHAFKRTIPGSGIDPRVNTERAGSRETKVAKMPDNLCTEMATGCKSTEHWAKVWAVKCKGDWGNYEMIERDIRRDIVDDYDEDDWYTLGMMEKHFDDKNVALTYKAVLEKNPALTP